MSALIPHGIDRLNARLRGRFERLLAAADITIDGGRPWDIQVHDQRVLLRVLLDRSVGLGDSYIDGWWDCDDLDEFIYRLLTLRREASFGLDLSRYGVDWLARMRNRQSRARATIVAKHHYDLPSDFYTTFLDPYNQYTCGYFKDTDELDRAQEAKLDLICRKLQLRPGQRVLDIGCGWGGFARFAAERYGVHVTGITISDEQLAYAREFTRGLDVTLLKRDYRAMTGRFDKVLVCGMIEHVGHKNYRSLMQVAHRCLAPEGLFLLHTIGNPVSVRAIDPWLDKHIFPNATLPSMKQLAEASEGLFVIEDMHNFRAYYVPTLRAWYRNFDAAWPRLAQRYDQRFYRTWRYYFLFCAGIFRAGNAQLWQLVFAKDRARGPYLAVR
ncbi:cyclopropane fatty acyl phospholipid synthase [Haliangium sp.]|uniref:cyclopropane fatty acyl phospholipid synthase n=1 Tax=Haliangium sp. TaxID=2663208 RepID=UPI003D1417F0